MKLTRILIAGVMLAGMTACGGNQGGEPVPSETAIESETPANKYVGRWVSDENGQPYLELSNDGKVKGTDGCNGFVTTYEDNIDGYAELKPFAQSLRGCPGVNTWLGKGRKLFVEGDTMTVQDRDGEEIGTLERES